MKAVGVMTFGGPEALEVVELPEPHAGPGELRIRVHAAAVNPTDTSAQRRPGSRRRTSTPLRTRHGRRRRPRRDRPRGGTDLRWATW